jgi:hypothetical protein
MSDPTEGRRRSIEADIDYFTTRFRARPRGHTMNNRWDMGSLQGGWRMGGPGSGWGPGSGSGSGSDTSLRVSDAERNAVADKLSAHFADGRLDEVEFKERLDRAMAAKTQGDLSGLFDDLPPLPTERDGTAAADDHHRRRRRSVPVLATILIVAVIGLAAVPPVHWFHVPWFLIGILAIFFWARVGRRHRHHHPHGDQSYR